MAQGFYDLEHAAERLGMSPQQLTQMAQRREVRAFADRGTWRFRTQDIDELARKRGMASDPDMPMADGSSDLEPPDASKTAGDSIFDDAERKKTGSDSDVRLVPHGSDVELKIESDSDVKLSRPPTASDSAVRLETTAPTAGKLVPGSDSGIRLVADSDSDVRIAQEPPAKPKSGVRLTGAEQHSDSDVRLDVSSISRGDSDIRLIDDSGTAETRLTKPKASDDFKFEEPLLLGEDSAVAAAPPAAEPKTSESSDFDLAPAPHLAEAKEKSASGVTEDMEFELSLERAKEEAADAAEAEEASSEFELALDDVGLSPLEEEKKEEIVETNFQVPKEESGSDSGLGLAEEDTSLEGSSEFELATEESESAAEEESSDDVVTLGEEEISEEEATALHGGDEESSVEEGVEELEGEAVDELLTEPGELEVEELAEEEGELVGAAAFAAAGIEAAPAEWPGWVAVPLLLTSVIMMLVGFLLFEMLRSVWSYNQPGLIGGTLSAFFGDLFK